jgi:hypothetical protein
VASHTQNPTAGDNAAPSAGIPGSTAAAHPTGGIPLPAHGFRTLDVAERESVGVAAADVISRAAALLLSAAGAKLGLAAAEEPDLDLAAARTLIDALAGLLAAAGGGLGEHREALHEGLRTLQSAFREAAAHPDEPGAGPGEAYLS